MNPEKPKSGARQPASILVVDDTPANLQMLAGMLKDRGYKVRPVPGGRPRPSNLAIDRSVQAERTGGKSWRCLN